MHPAINREVSATRIADFHRQARRDATALTAARELRAQKATRRPAMLSRTVTRLTHYIAALVVAANPVRKAGTPGQPTKE
jgi:hypothetical protein